jgi:hypothetical protein
MEQEVTVAMQRQGKHVSAATNKHVRIGEILESVFSILSVPRLHSEDPAAAESWYWGGGMIGPMSAHLSHPSKRDVTRPLLSLKRRPHLKHVKLFKKIWLLVPTNSKPRITVLAKASCNLTE